ncbi:MAG: twin-arginine translocase TatA/TatE family subunit [Anaerolineae bacterium]|jgi:sec-independent protein translocase protein TatA
MLGQLGWPELLILLAVVLVLFGVGRVSAIGRELGLGIRQFRDGLAGEEDEADR